MPRATAKVGQSARGAAAAKTNDGVKRGASYDAFKEFKGQRYTGMKVGRGHRWKYDAGDWVEKKVTPDKWEFRYTVPKRRAGRAPEGSGVPVGTEYHWYILADQTVKKLDANNYSTDMVGIKYKLAHKRADKGEWSATDDGKRKRLIKLLQEMISELEQAPVPLKTPNEPKAPAKPPAKAPGKRKAA
jgi:hypothetical protein